MMPGAGLYLPESLHVNHEVASNRAEARAMKQKYFERKSATTQDTHKNLNSNRTSVALSRKSSEDVTKVFSSLSTVFDFADYASSHDKVSSDSEVFVNLLQRVRQDVTEASRLYASQPVTDYFESWPDKKTWIDAILLDIQRALNDIGLYMETVRVSGDDGGTAGLRRKFEWVLSHQKKLISRQQNLTVCHQSLMTAVHVMLAAEMNAAFGGQDPVYEAPTRPWIQEDARDTFRSPHSRQRWRLSQKNLSLPSIRVSEAEGDKFDVQSVDSAPVELPGSTPDDLPLPDNWDLYAPPTKPRSASMDAVRPDQSAVQLPNTFGTDSNVSRHKTTQSQPQNLTQAPHGPLPPRRSFDQVRPPASSTRQMPLASLDRARPRAYSDQVLPSTSFGVGPRASFDQVRQLPTLNEKPLERYDSNASVSVTKAATVPITTMRFRPKAVNVRKPPTKHRSLPSTLPHFHSQTSLMDDLSNWVLPASARDSYQSHDSPISVHSSTPSTSIASSPVSTKSPADYPGTVKGMGPIASMPVAIPPPTSANISPSARASPTYTAHKPPQPLPLRSPPPVPHAVAGTERRMSFERPRESIIDCMPKPHIPVSKPKLEQSAQSLASGPESEASASRASTTTQSPVAVPEVPPPLPPRPQANNAEESTLLTRQTISAPQQDAASPDDVEARKEKDHKPSAKELSVSETKESITASTSSAEASLPENKIIEPSKPSIPADALQPAVPVARSPPVPTAPPQRMTAEAKRRAAHARRMQLAFGAGQNKAGATS